MEFEIVEQTISDLTHNEVQNIYTKLSVSPDNIYFDIIADNNFIVENIEEIFDIKFLHIETKLLQDDTMLLNINFATLIKHLVKEHNFRKVGFIFIGFCDYFDLDYNKTYIQLQDKLKILIELSTKNMIGSKQYSKRQIKASNGVKITTLFDMVKNKL